MGVCVCVRARSGGGLGDVSAIKSSHAVCLGHQRLG